MPNKLVRKLKLIPRTIKTLHVLVDGTKKEYQRLYYYMAPQIYIPKYWMDKNEEGELSHYELHKIPKARSFIVIPSNVTEGELDSLIKYLKSMKKAKRRGKKGGKR